jgi:hypothetical protein
MPETILTPEQIKKENKRLYDIIYYKNNADWIREKARAAYHRRKLANPPNSPRTPAWLS